MWLHRMHHYFPSPVKFSTGSRWVTGTQPVVTERLLLLTPRSFLPLSVHDSIIQTSSLCKKWNIQKDWEGKRRWRVNSSLLLISYIFCFPDSSVGKESTCNEGDLGLIPGSERFPGEGIGYPLQYSWASFVTQLVKNPPTMWETRVWEDPLEKGKAIHFRISAWRVPWTV